MIQAEEDGIWVRPITFATPWETRCNRGVQSEANFEAFSERFSGATF
jgi:hypothetical protein